MVPKPDDTTTEAWAAQRAILSRIGPEARVRLAIDLSDAVRAIQIEGLRARHGWSGAECVRQIVADHLGVDLPRS